MPGRLRLWTLLALWLTLWLVAAGFLLYADIQAAKHRVEAETDELAVVLNDRLVANDQILRGFSALVGVLAERNETELRRYAAEVIANSPQVFGLEIVRRTARDERAALAAQIQRSTGRPFALKSFSYRTRQWAELEDKLYYSPIVFMEPMRPDSEGVLGLDMDSVPFLRDALSQAQAATKAVASHPFRLIEGNLAYVVFFPLDARRAADASSLLTVNMVIDAERLLPDFYRQRLPLDRWDLTIRHADFSATDERGYLVHLAANQAQGLETALLPAYAGVRSLSTLQGRLLLDVRRQFGWRDLSPEPQFFLLLVAALGTFLIAKWCRLRERDTLIKAENAKELWRLANYDALTDIPNRRLLMDRLTQQTYRAARQDQRFAVLFLDLDHFKAVNDQYGHAVGDRLLKFFARAVGDVLRAGDTFGRLSGDEFLLALAETAAPPVTEELEARIRDALAAGLTLDSGQVLRPSVSIGVVVYPDDAATLEDLLSLADQRMYAAKARRAGDVLAKNQSAPLSEQA